jgi:hypothetical protein
VGYLLNRSAEGSGEKEAMFEEREEKGKRCRLFWEDCSLHHCEGSAGLIYSMTDHKRIWEYNGLPGETAEGVKKTVCAMFEALTSCGFL